VETGRRQTILELQELIDEMNCWLTLSRPKSCRASSRPGRDNMGRETGSLASRFRSKDGSSPDTKDLNLQENLKLLKSPYHEHRFTALMIWVRQYETRDDRQKEEIYGSYLANTACIKQLGLRRPLRAQQSSGSPTRERPFCPVSTGRLRLSLGRRIAILATYTFIKAGESGDTFAIADQLMDDQQDLIHKAVGWMLREVGKRVSEVDEKAFLESRYRTMSRTMLRYAIERFPEADRRHFLAR